MKYPKIIFPKYPESIFEIWDFLPKENSSKQGFIPSFVKIPLSTISRVNLQRVLREI